MGELPSDEGVYIASIGQPRADWLQKDKAHEKAWLTFWSGGGDVDLGGGREMIMTV